MNGITHPSPAYWEAQGKHHGRCDAASVIVPTLGSDDTRESINRRCRAGDHWVYEQYGPAFAPLADPDDVRRIFADEPDQVPSAWRVAYEYGYTTGWWSMIT